jgi:hypothetical protein
VSIKSQASDFMPPNPPWEPLTTTEEIGYLSVYLSDPLARYPVRHITRVADNTSDPNIETMTYGLFSTCEDKMRKGVVRDGRRWLFFMATLPGKGRSLTGMYKVGWHAPGPLFPGVDDFALAASEARWIAPIPASEVGGSLGDQLRRKFRLYLRLDSEHTAELRELIESKPDLTDAYLAEVARLERFSKSVTGYTYPTWEREQGFEGSDAAQYLTPREGGGEQATNTSPTGRWRCVECDSTTENAARLKLCPTCKAPGTLVPDA